MSAAALPALLFCYAGFLRRWAGDDGLINVRVVRHLLAGHGFVFNVGERCEAVTSAAWIAVLWGLGELGFDVEQAAWMVGLGAATVGMFLAALASAALCVPPGDNEERLWFLPFGGLAYAAIPVAWDYATSALENGIGVGFLGASYWFVARAVTHPGGRGLAWMAAFIGLAPLVRPDYALYGAALVPVLLIATPGWSRKVWLGLCALLPGVAFQVFRMGYFAALVPNTALAKEAFEPRWDQGYLYFKNTFASYRLMVPLVCVLILVVCWAVGSAKKEGRLRALAVFAMGGAGIVHVIYVVRVGGDFMHGRMLLPGLFAIFASVAAIPVTIDRPGELTRNLIIVVVLAGWAFVCAKQLRAQVWEFDSILDERRWYTDTAQVANPTRLVDYAKHGYYLMAIGVRGRVAAGCPAGDAALQDDSAEPCRRLAIYDPGDGYVSDHVEGKNLELEPTAVAPSVLAVVGFRPLGLSGGAVGLRISLTDSYGLADPLAARTELKKRGRPGHEKSFPTHWFMAKYGAKDSTRDERVVTARRALGCGLLRELQLATHEPMSWSRFAKNVRLSFPLHTLRLPHDPNEAVLRFCGRT